jgi:hypothetical protein
MRFHGIRTALGYAVVWLLVALCYKPHYGAVVDSTCNRNYYQESACEADNLTAICGSIV